jgi:hypothetical protein
VYLGYLVLIMCIWLLFGRAVFGTRRGLLTSGQDTRGTPDTRPLRWAMVVIAFLTTQSFFEPDYGSYLKHLSPVLPLLIAATIGWKGTPLLRGLASGRPAAVPRVRQEVGEHVT